MSNRLKDLTRGVNPFNRYCWRGQWLSLDGTDATKFGPKDVAKVVAAGDSGDAWDGTVAAVLRLKDGRYACYETFYGPTGDGFAKDAYGANADVSFGADLDTVVRLGLTDEGRSLCGIDNPNFP